MYIYIGYFRRMIASTKIRLNVKKFRSRIDETRTARQNYPNRTGNVPIVVVSICMHTRLRVRIIPVNSRIRCERNEIQK